MASKLSKSKKNTLWKHWLEVETKITEEIQWLRSVIAIFSDTEQITSMGLPRMLLTKTRFLNCLGKNKSYRNHKIPATEESLDKQKRTKKEKEDTSWR